MDTILSVVGDEIAQWDQEEEHCHMCQLQVDWMIATHHCPFSVAARHSPSKLDLLLENVRDTCTAVSGARHEREVSQDGLLVDTDALARELGQSCAGLVGSFIGYALVGKVVLSTNQPYVGVHWKGEGRLSVQTHQKRPYTALYLHNPAFTVDSSLTCP